MATYKVIGIMSGTSLDGVDLCFCALTKNDHEWTYDIINCETHKYTREWKDILSGIYYETPAFEFLKLHREYGKYLGSLVNNFLKDSDEKPHFIASHGHTIFHQPSKGITCQIGDGNSIAAKTGIKTISDFRSMDVALGGHGAPLVPIGDLLLFKDYTYCLNIGGFANISIKKDNNIFAFDICPANIVINQLVSDLGLEYDLDGKVGRTGEVNQKLLEELNNLEYYSQNGPKSLGKEWIDENFFPIIYNFDISIGNKIRTIYEHIAIQVKNVVSKTNDDKILVSGGGALNLFLIGLLNEKLKNRLVIPDKHTIEFKESLIFALLGALRMENEINCLKNVTGAKYNNIGGVICG